MINVFPSRAARRVVSKLLASAGIEINGASDYSILVHDPMFYQRVLSHGSLGLGEAYVEGMWDCDALDEFVYRMIVAKLDHQVLPARILTQVMSAQVINLQRPRKAFHIGEHHYDIGNDFYRLMLDSSMTYTCAYWRDATTLDEAQEAKLALICRKLRLKPGMSVLDVGCGWGSFAEYAARNHGVKVVGITVSREQAALARERCKGLDVDIRFQDYRAVQETFDRIVSIGMFEHVGPRNYRTYMKVISQNLKDDGLFLLHTIGTNSTRFAVDPWIDKYIFPGGVLPTFQQIVRAAEPLFIVEHVENLGGHYDPTLMHWMANIDAHRDEIRSLGYDERFYRMWRYFLLSCAGADRARRNQLWQIVYSKR